MRPLRGLPATLAACIAAATLSSCGTPRPATQSSGVPPVTMGTREAFEVQERMDEFLRRASRASTMTPGTTVWREAASPPASVRTLRSETPGGLLLALDSSAHWGDLLGDAAGEQTMRVRTEGDDAAIGVVFLWDFMDDAVAGHDFRVSMRRTGTSWQIERFEERYHCRRKVTADGRCG